MASDSKFVVWAALAGNVAVATTKYIAASISGSSAMLTEAVHSTADTLNQLMLLLGNRRAARPADARHPFGYDGELYFWTFVVAVIVLLAGGVGSIVQGTLELRDPHPIESLPISFAVLALSALFEGLSLFVGWRASRRVVAKRSDHAADVSTWRFIKVSKDPNLFETLLEDGAAMIGIALAALGVLGNGVLHILWMDGAASIAIGLLLVVTSLVIADATRGLIAGEAASPAVVDKLREACRDAAAGLSADLKTLHLGPNTILVTITLDRDCVGDDELGPTMDRLSAAVRQVDERIRHVAFTLANSA